MPINEICRRSRAARFPVVFLMADIDIYIRKLNINVMRGGNLRVVAIFRARERKLNEETIISMAAARLIFRDDARAHIINEMSQCVRNDRVVFFN